MTTRSAPLRYSLAVSFAVLLVLAGCGTSGGSESAEETTTTTETTTPDEGDDSPDSITYEVGQCFKADDSTEFVDCSQEHQYEVVGIIDSPFDVIPDDSDDQMKIACAEVLDAYLGNDSVSEGIKVNNLAAAGDVGATVADTEDELVVCLGEAPTGLMISASIEGGAKAAIAPYVPVLQLEPGDCFLLYEDYFYVGTPAECTNTDALVSAGTFVVDDGEFPGDDALLAMRNEQCPTLAEDLGVPNFSDASGTAPSEDEWRIGVRVVTCDVPVATR